MSPHVLAFLFLLAYIFFSGSQQVLNKTYQVKMGNAIQTYLAFALAMGICGSISFFALSGFEIIGDRTMFLYAGLVSIPAIVGNLSTPICMSRVNLATVTISTNAGALIIPALYGFVILGEPLTFLRILGLLLILTAFLLNFFAGREKEGNSKKADPFGTFICVLLFFTTGICNVFNKAFQLSGSSSNDMTYLAWLNVFMVIWISIVICVVAKRRGQTLRQFTAGFNYRVAALLPVSSLIGCIGMTFNMRALKILDISIFSPLYSSMFIIYLVLASRFIFKEYVAKQTYIAVGLAILSVIIMAFA